MAATVRLRILRIVLLAVAVFGILGALAVLQMRQLDADAKPLAPMVPDFALTDDAGRPADELLLQGKWSLVFFGFTWCPDICPTTLAELTAARERLTQAQKDKLQVVFVSVDWLRDTPDSVRDYLSPFQPGVTGLTGTEEQLREAARSFKVYFQKVDQQGGEFTFDHSSFTYLIDPEGRVVDILPYKTGPDAIAALLSKRVSGS